VLPYIIRLPSPLLRVEWADRIADRMRLNSSVLREEIRRAAGSRRELRAGEPLPTLDVSLAEKELLRGCLENEALADEILAALGDDAIFEGLATSRIFQVLLEVRGRGEKPDVSALEESLTPAEQQLLYGCQFAAFEPLSRDSAMRQIQALRRKKMERKREDLQAAIRAAERARDTIRLAELLRSKSELASRLASLGRT